MKNILIAILFGWIFAISVIVIELGYRSKTNSKMITGIVQNQTGIVDNLKRMLELTKRNLELISEVSDE